MRAVFGDADNELQIAISMSPVMCFKRAFQDHEEYHSTTPMQSKSSQASCQTYKHPDLLAVTAAISELGPRYSPPSAQSTQSSSQSQRPHQIQPHKLLTISKTTPRNQNFMMDVWKVVPRQDEEKAEEMAKLAKRPTMEQRALTSFVRNLAA